MFSLRASLVGLASLAAVVPALTAPAHAQRGDDRPTYTVRNATDNFRGIRCDARNQRVVIRDGAGGTMIPASMVRIGRDGYAYVRFSETYRQQFEAFSLLNDYFRARQQAAVGEHVPAPPAEYFDRLNQFYNDASAGRTAFWSPEGYPYPQFHRYGVSAFGTPSATAPIPLRGDLINDPDALASEVVYRAIDFCDDRAEETGRPRADMTFRQTEPSLDFPTHPGLPQPGEVIDDRDLRRFEREIFRPR